MCDRYTCLLPAETLHQTFRTINPLLNLGPSWNIAPLQFAPVVYRHPERGGRHLDLFQWGLLRWWQRDKRRSRPTIVRAERLTHRGVFYGALVRRRALVPAQAFYKWNGKQLYAITRRDAQPMAFAGLWQECRLPDWRISRTFAIVTTVGNTEMAELRDRVPVILEPSDWPVWLGEAQGDPRSLLHPALEGTWLASPVGDPRNTGPELLERTDVARDGTWFDWRGAISDFDRDLF